VPTQPSDATRVLGELIRVERHAQELSQEALADRCGVHWTFLGQVERGRRNLSLHDLLKIADGLAIDPGQLVRGLQAPPQ